MNRDEYTQRLARKSLALINSKRILRGDEVALAGLVSKLLGEQGDYGVLAARLDQLENKVRLLEARR